MSLSFTSPLEWWLDLSAEQITHSRQQSQQTATPLSRHQNFLNHLCAQAIVPWLKAEYDADVTIWPHPETLPSVWEVVDGVAIAFGDVRVLLMPSETIDTEGFSVPQEWVDIPTWAADYYVAVQVSLDPSYLRAWGYASHAQLKQKGVFDAIDRTYDIRREFLRLDFNAFWVICQHCPEILDREALRAESKRNEAISGASFSELPEEDSFEGADEAIVQQLMQHALPRLAMPTKQWNRLLVNDGWRQRFYEQRLFAMHQAIVPAFANDLKNWAVPHSIHNWQFIGATDDIRSTVMRDVEIRPLALSLRKDDRVCRSTPQRIKRIHFSSQPNPLFVLLLMSVSPTSEDKMEVVIQAHPFPGEDCVPAHLSLELRNQVNQVVKTVRSRDRDNFIQFPQFTCPVGTRFSLHLCVEACRVIEYFIAGNLA